MSSQTHPIQEHSLAGAVISFGRTLKENGFGVSTASILDALAGIRSVGIDNIQDFKTALKAVFVRRKEEHHIFDKLFQEFWLDRLLAEEVAATSKQKDGSSDDVSEPLPSEGTSIVADVGLPGLEEEQACENAPYVIYSPNEVLRDQDFKDLPESHDHRMQQLIQELLSPLLRRFSVRKRPVTSGNELDFRRILRRNVRYGGEICELPRLKPRLKVKRIVFLCDVSGSMNPYQKFLLQFIKELQNITGRVETFVFSTSLHRITPFLKHLSFSKAMEEIAKTVRDWAGGTRIGECLEQFTSYRSGGMLGPSTVVLIHSDGWDRGNPQLLEREMNKIHRRCYRVLWINPLLGGPSYEPTCMGMRTALPFVDNFLPGHNLASLERLAGTLRGLL